MKDIAYVVRTSGTTSTAGLGTPIFVPHTSFLINLLGIRTTFSASDKPMIPLLSPLTFDPSLIELFLPLLEGGTLVIPPHSAILAPSKLFSILSKCSLAMCTSSLFRRLSTADRLSLLGGATKLRTLVLGGETFPVSLVAGSSIPVYNIYGTTECSVWATLWKYDGGDRAFLGDALPGTEVELRSEAENGVSELWIGGPERICYLPGEEEPLIMRATGDLVKRVDGGIVFVGRKETGQAKVEGKRVGLREVAEVIRRFEVDCEWVPCYLFIHRI
jgi:acyl-CoA synthetase